MMGAVAALAFAPAQALAQRGGAPQINGAALAAGKKAAPELIQATGINCAVSEARLIGRNGKTSFYELACGPTGMGYVVVAEEDKNTAISCLEATGNLACALKENADPKAALAPMLAKANVNCAPTGARGIGQAPGLTYLEVLCSSGVGYVITAESAPLDTNKPIRPPQNCLIYDEAQSNIKCTLADHATRLAVVDSLAKTGAASCVVKDRRFVGSMQNGSSYFEAACEDGKGVVFRTALDGSLQETLDCVRASASIPGGCKLTDTRQAETEQNQLYTRLVKDAGGNCEVQKYALFPSKAGEETVELACQDATGVVGVFRTSGASQVVDCGRAEAIGFKCSLTTKVNYAPLTADLKKVRPEANSCDVSNTRVVGKGQNGNVTVEVACADGLKGYLIEYKVDPNLTAVNAVGCALAGRGVCTLPGNV